MGVAPTWPKRHSMPPNWETNLNPHNGEINQTELSIPCPQFSKSLAPLGMQVKEYTGDMQLTKREIMATQVIVTTPEKWDVVTRKGSDGLVQSVGLLIIDEDRKSVV